MSGREQLVIPAWRLVSGSFASSYITPSKLSTLRNAVILSNSLGYSHLNFSRAACWTLLSSSMDITTLAETKLGFVPEPDGRGTFGILWSSLAVLFLNTWTVLHFNIPNPNLKFWQWALHRMKWIAIATVAPEFISLMAADDYDSAKMLQRIMKGRVPWWTLTHGYYANMGGYKVSYKLASGWKVIAALTVPGFFCIAAQQDPRDIAFAYVLLIKLLGHK